MDGIGYAGNRDQRRILELGHAEGSTTGSAHSRTVRQRRWGPRLEDNSSQQRDHLVSVIPLSRMDVPEYNTGGLRLGVALEQTARSKATCATRPLLCLNSFQV